MIEGVKLTISSKELAEVLQSRVEYHAAKAAWYDKQVKTLAPELQQMAEDADNIGKVSNKGDTLQNLQAGAQQHKNKATLFKFMSAHVIKDETYLLNESDLQRLEIINRSW